MSALATSDGFWWVSFGRPTNLAVVPAPVDAARADELAEEAKLVARAQAGDRLALGALLKKYGPSLYRSVLMPRLGSAAAAEEGLSATYAKVVEKLDKFTWQGSGFYPWLRVVAMRIALDMLRARRRETPFDTDDLAREVDRAEAELGHSADHATLADEDARVAKARVERALASINPRYAQAIRLRVLEERSREEVAVALGVTTATFDVVLHRALAAMKKALQPAEES